MLGGPIYGRIGDVLGERTALLVALSSTMATYVVTGLLFNMSYVFSAVICWTDEQKHIILVLMIITKR